MKSAIAASDFYAIEPGGARRRLTLAIGAPVRDAKGAAWQCRVTIADLLLPTSISGSDSFEALARTVTYVRSHLAGLRAEGWEFSRDRAGRKRLDVETSWFSLPREAVPRPPHARR